jgi:addiction module RelE/StbE family toxin
MDFRVVITRPAIKDLATIVKYIAKHDPVAAERLGTRLIAKAESLTQLPLRGRLVPERKQADCRELIWKPYRIVYRVREETATVQVLRFWHGAQGNPVIVEPENSY